MKKHILCFGDSNTHGYCADPADCADPQFMRFHETERWTKLLQTQLGDDYLVLEEGLSGRTTVFPDPLDGDLRGLDYLPACLKSHSPIALLVIMLGTNDTKERMGASAPCIALGMRRLVEVAKNLPCWAGAPNILVVAPPPILPGMEQSAVAGTMGRGCVEKSQQLGTEYAKIALETGVHFLDAGAIGAEFNPIDCMHLTRRGHATLADALGLKIPSLL